VRFRSATSALVELDDAAQQELALATSHGVDDLAPHEPGGLTRDAELASKLGGRGRFLGGGEQPDRQEPLAQVGARARKDCTGNQRALVMAAGALAETAPAQLPGTLVPTARADEALGPAVLEDRLPAVLLGRIELHELDQRLGMVHLCLPAAVRCSRGYSPHRT
jgi:hypothetical protein